MIIRFRLMVSKKLVDIRESEWDQVNSIGDKIKKLNTKNLREIKTTDEIMLICHEVISAVDTLVLVRIDEWELINRKLKRQKDHPLQHNFDDVWVWGAKIRTDWNALWWKRNPPHGWVWYDRDDTLLSCIYQSHWSDTHEALIRKEIADNPHGAIVLLREMKTKLNKLLSRDYK